MATATRRRKKLSDADLQVLALAVHSAGRAIESFTSPEEAQAWLDTPSEPTNMPRGLEEASVPSDAEPPPDTVAQPHDTPAAPEPPGATPALPADVQIPCDKCHGSGVHRWKFAGADRQGPCWKCKTPSPDNAAPGKGFLDHHDLERNRRFQLKKTAHRWTFLVKAVVDGEPRTAPKQFAAGGDVYRVAGTAVERVAPEAVRVDDTLLVPRLRAADAGRTEVVELLAAVVQQAEEKKPRIPF
jgi:hypothetical protein